MGTVIMINQTIFFKAASLAALLALTALLAMPLGAFAADAARINHITVLHTNDTHGFLVPYDTEKAFGIGGAAYRASIAGEIRRDVAARGGNYHTLLLDAGDVLENNPMSNFFRGEADIEVMNAMGYEAMTFGNHDFGFGMDRMLELEKMAKFPVLSANVLDRKTGAYLFKPFIVREFNGLRIAIFGLTSHTLFYNSSKEDLERITFLKPDEAYAKILPEMLEKADAILFLSHLGVDGDREFAKKHPEVAVIIGGHSHTFLEAPEKVDGTVIAHAGKNGDCIGRLDLTFVGKKLTRHEGRLIYVAEKGINDIVKKYRDRLDPQINVKIGHLDRKLENMSKLEEPTPLFNMVLRNLRDHAKADFAMETCMSVGSRLDTGDVMLKDIYRIMPYNNFVVTVKMTGEEIQRLMDYSASKRKSPFFIQTYGLSAEYDGPKAKNITINGRPLEKDRLYLVATDNFMLGGGAEDGVLNGIEESRKNFTDRIIRDVIIENVKNGTAFRQE